MPLIELCIHRLGTIPTVQVTTFLGLLYNVPWQNDEALRIAGAEKHVNGWDGLFLVPVKGGLGTKNNFPEGKDYKWYISGI